MNIATLTLNPALDKSTLVDRLVPEQKLRCRDVQTDPGGGGINVSRGVRRLEGSTTAVFPAGGPTGEKLAALLAAEGIPTRMVNVPGETRENISVTDAQSGAQYRFTLPGQDTRRADAEACLDALFSLSPDLVVASGSLPPGLPDDYYAVVAARAKAAGVRLVVDTSGPALHAALDVGVFMLKPNLKELSALAGVEKLEMNRVDDAAMDIIHRGKCEIVVVSLGAQGALLVTKDGFEHIPAPPVLSKTSVGAGDSMVAGMVWALSQGKSWRDMAAMGVACGTAATLHAGTALFQPNDAWKLLEWINRYGERYRFMEF